MDQVIFRDGLGERRRLTSPAQTGRLDVLCLDWELTSAPSFEPALRARIARLATFHHPNFAAVRGVQRVGEPPSCTLAIASDATPGLRLSELLEAGERKAITLDIGIAVFLIRQLVAAIAALHDDGEDLSHGAISLERVVLTPDARLVVVEHMLGPAIEELQLSHVRLWEDLRVAAPRTTAPAQLDQRSDVMQLGLVALSLILARPITDDEYPTHVQDLVATAWAVSARGNLEPVPAGLRAWLARALQLDIRNSFSTAMDAQEDLNKMFGAETATDAPDALQAFLSKLPGAPTVVAAAPPAPTPVREPVILESVVHAPRPEPMISETPRPELRPVPFSVVAKTEHGPFDAPRPESRTAPRAIVKDDEEPDESESTPVSKPSPNIVRPISVVPPIAASSAVAPVPVSIADAPRPASRIAEPPPAPKPRVTTPSGSSGSSAPSVPYVIPPLDLASSEEKEPVDMVTRFRIHKSAKWVTPVAACALILLATGGVFAARRYLMPAAPAPASGKLAINTSPDGATVIVDGQPRGITPVNLTVSAGPHTVELRGQGDPRTMSITVDPGAEVSQYIELPKSAPTLGGLQVKSDPNGARVTIDGIPRGVSPVTVAGLAPGDHTVVVEGEAGSTRQTVVVEPGVTGSLTAQLSNQGGAPASGWISVSAPQEVQLFENGRLVGSSETDRLMVVAGSHQLEFVNQAIGYRSTKTVQVSAGKTSTIKLDFPNGTIALNATPWADVWIDGSRVGETPIGNLPLTIGTHEVIFRHPDLGEQKHVATVTLNAPTRLSVDMRKK